MSLRYYANAAPTSLTAAVTNSATTLPVASTAGLPTSYPYTLILDRGNSYEEVVEVTAGNGLNLTVTRGADGTTAFAHGIGAVVEHGISARDIREANEHVNSATGHLLTGNVVGTSDTQTLTNKDMQDISNIVPDLHETWTVTNGAAINLSLTGGTEQIIPLDSVTLPAGKSSYVNTTTDQLDFSATGMGEGIYVIQVRAIFTGTATGVTRTLRMDGNYAYQDCSAMTYSGVNSVATRTVVLNFFRPIFDGQVAFYVFSSATESVDIYIQVYRIGSPRRTT